MLYPAELRAREPYVVTNPIPAPLRKSDISGHQALAGAVTCRMIEPSAAEKLIGGHVTCMPIESLPVGQCAGAVLRENVYAERDQPPFDRVAMDGVALASAAALQGRRRYRVQAIQAAGDPPSTLSRRIIASR